eukprot:2839_1
MRSVYVENVLSYILDGRKNGDDNKNVLNKVSEINGDTNEGYNDDDHDTEMPQNVNHDNDGDDDQINADNDGDDIMASIAPLHHDIDGDDEKQEMNSHQVVSHNVYGDNNNNNGGGHMHQYINNHYYPHRRPNHHNRNHHHPHSGTSLFSPPSSPRPRPHQRSHRNNQNAPRYHGIHGTQVPTVANGGVNTSDIHKLSILRSDTAFGEVIGWCSNAHGELQPRWTFKTLQNDKKVGELRIAIVCEWCIKRGPSRTKWKLTEFGQAQYKQHLTVHGIFLNDSQKRNKY